MSGPSRAGPADIGHDFITSAFRRIAALLGGQRRVWLLFFGHTRITSEMTRLPAGSERSQSWTELSRGADGRLVDLAADMAFELAEVAFEALGDVARRAVIGFLVS